MEWLFLTEQRRGGHQQLDATKRTTKGRRTEDVFGIGWFFQGLFFKSSWFIEIDHWYVIIMVKVSGAMDAANGCHNTTTWTRMNRNVTDLVSPRIMYFGTWLIDAGWKRAALVFHVLRKSFVYLRRLNVRDALELLISHYSNLYLLLLLLLCFVWLYVVSFITLLF